ncbi:MAG TPA: type I 3-dehydroquinate dehydratase [Candidatus Polarisedimenticolia bacterium]|nr:type I 3-dehydroquinate dehydratase [Candidatus Polarisedimenticolia bacterium]
MLIQVILAESKEQLLRDYRAASPTADLVELRLDRLDAGDLGEVFAASGKPRIAACRSRAQGGFFSGSEAQRGEVLKQAIAHGAEYVDLEFESGDEELLKDAGQSRIILSCHRRGGTPTDLEPIYRRMADRAPGAILKLIPYADACSDNLRVRDLLRRARTESTDLIAFCMGERGKASRILASAWGSWGVYAPARPEATTAPGQFLLSEMSDLFRVKDLHEKTPVTGVLGHPVSGSLSPLLYNRAYRHLGLPGVFVPFEAQIVAEFLPLLSELPITGLAITHPHKLSLYRHCDELEPTAEEAGAVNTAVRSWNRLVGYNTDVGGVLAPLQRVMSLKGTTVGILGAGGAAAAAALACRRSGARVILFARAPEKARETAKRLGCELKQFTEARRFHGALLINATPLGMDSDRDPNILGWEEARTEVACDLVYHPLETAFLREARRAGARIISGMEVFLEQAVLQFPLLTGREAPRELFESLVAAPAEKEQD